MTVPATTRRAGPFNGNGATTSFPFDFKVFSDEDLQVVVADADGIESTLVLDTDYSATLNPDQDADPGGSITYPLSGDPLAAGETLTVTGAVEYSQELDLPGGGNFSPRALENALDRTTFQIQQLAEAQGRALTLPVSAATADTELPVPEAGKVIAWNSTADGLVNLDSADLASVVVAGTAYTDVFGGTGAQTAFTLTANPGNVNALAVAIGGIVQTNGTDFTVSGTTLTFTSAPESGTDNVVVRYVAALPVGTANAQDVTYNSASGVTRTQAAKNLDVVSANDYGAAPNGTDCSTQVQLAVNSGARRVVFSDPTGGSGVFAFKDVAIPAGVEVDGCNCSFKLLPLSGSVGGGFHALFKGNAAAGITVRNLNIDGNSGAQTPEVGQEDRYAGLYFVDCDRLTVESVRFSAAPYGDFSIRVRQGSNVRVRRCFVLTKGIFYNAYSGSQYDVSLDDNETSGCGISINDDQAAQHLYGWSINRNKIRASNALNEVGIGCRASNGEVCHNLVIGGYFGITASVAGSFQQHDLRITDNTVIADSGSFNPYGIEHYAYDILIANNALTNCSIVSSATTGRNIRIANNVLTATLTTAFSDRAIVLSAGTFTGVSITGNVAKGFGSGVQLSRVDASLVVADNIFDLTDYAGSSEGIRLENVTAGSVTLTGAVIRGNVVRNASRAWLYVLGNGANTLTLNDFRAVFNVTTGTSAAVSLAASAVLGSDSMHSFNEFVYPTFQNVPTSSAGLPSGGIWRDSGASDVLKMVP